MMLQCCGAAAGFVFSCSNHVSCGAGSILDPRVQPRSRALHRIVTAVIGLVGPGPVPVPRVGQDLHSGCLDPLSNLYRLPPTMPTVCPHSCLKRDSFGAHQRPPLSAPRVSWIFIFEGPSPAQAPELTGLTPKSHEIYLRRGQTPVRRDNHPQSRFRSSRCKTAPTTNAPLGTAQNGENTPKDDTKRFAGTRAIDRSCYVDLPYRMHGVSASPPTKT